MMRIGTHPRLCRACLALLAVAAVLASCLSGSAPSAELLPEQPELATQVEIRRTTYGVPQILAENLRAGAFALAYVQLEDHGLTIITGMQAARGRMALVGGRAYVESDARNRLRRAHAAESFRLLHNDTREVYIGFAAGMNHFIRAHAEELPDWVRPDYTAIDVLARDIAWPAEGTMNAFRRRLLADPADAALLVESDGVWQRATVRSSGVTTIPRLLSRDDSGTIICNEGSGCGKMQSSTSRSVAAGMSSFPTVPDGLDRAVLGPSGGRTGSIHEDENVGSNAWALGPSRSATGNAILLRNPHLDWTAGYYEAHLRVPGVIDFYGDFRIGGPFSVIGGFNRHLGFSTTNNQTRSHEFYAFYTDPNRPDHILLDGRSLPLHRQEVTVEYREDGVSGTESREFWTSEFGPVVHRTDSLVYIFRPANNGNYRAGEQWLEMMKADDLDSWLTAMRIGARTTSHFTYADADGNIFYVSVSAPPVLPHPAGGDSLAILATRSDQLWSRVVPFDSLPQLLNPPGGYLHNENDSPHYTNLNQILDHEFSFWVEPPRLRLRSQHGAGLLHNDRVFTLEDVVEAKHSMKMLLADRVKVDLIAAVRAHSPEGEIADAIELLADWDNTAAAESRGAVLFEMWWNHYRARLGNREPHAVPWAPDAPMTTPSGLAEPDVAGAVFADAVQETVDRYGSWDVAWGEVHRVRRGDIDVPVGGCGGALGCFRVLNFTAAADGKRVVDGGDGWVLAVEFGEEPRAYTILAYGQSPDPRSPYHANQAALFAANRMKPVYWSESEIEQAVVERYRPGSMRTFAGHGFQSR